MQTLHYPEFRFSTAQALFPDAKKQHFKAKDKNARKPHWKNGQIIEQCFDVPVA